MAGSSAKWRAHLDTILKNLRIGHKRSTAVQAVGASFEGFQDFLRRAQAPTASDEDKEILDQVLKAEAAAEMDIVGHWMNAMPADWRAAEKFLSKRFPDNWGDQPVLHKHEVEGVTSQQALQIMKDAESRDLISQLLRRAGQVAGIGEPSPQSDEAERGQMDSSSTLDPS